MQRSVSVEVTCLGLTWQVVGEFTEGERLQVGPYTIDPPNPPELDVDSIYIVGEFDYILADDFLGEEIYIRHRSITGQDCMDTYKSIYGEIVDLALQKLIEYGGR